MPEERRFRELGLSFEGTLFLEEGDPIGESPNSENLPFLERPLEEEGVSQDAFLLSFIIFGLWFVGLKKCPKLFMSREVNTFCSALESGFCPMYISISKFLFRQPK